MRSQPLLEMQSARVFCCARLERGDGTVPAATLQGMRSMEDNDTPFFEFFFLRQVLKKNDRSLSKKKKKKKKKLASSIRLRLFCRLFLRSRQAR